MEQKRVLFFCFSCYRRLPENPIFFLPYSTLNNVKNELSTRIFRGYVSPCGVPKLPLFLGPHLYSIIQIGSGYKHPIFLRSNFSGVFFFQKVDTLMLRIERINYIKKSNLLSFKHLLKKTPIFIALHFDFLMDQYLFVYINK